MGFVKLEQQDHIGIVTIDRQEALNALNSQVLSELDKVLEEARSTPDRQRRTALYHQAQEILDEDQPYCFLYVPYALPVVQNRFMGIKPALAGIMYNFEEWWVPKSLQRYKVTP